MNGENNLNTTRLMERGDRIREFLSQIQSAGEEMNRYIQCIANSSISKDSSSIIVDNWNNLIKTNDSLGQACTTFANDLVTALTEFNAQINAANDTEEQSQESSVNVFTQSTDAINSLIGNN